MQLRSCTRSPSLHAHLVCDLLSAPSVFGCKLPAAHGDLRRHPSLCSTTFSHREKSQPGSPATKPFTHLKAHRAHSRSKLGCRQSPEFRPLQLCPEIKLHRLKPLVSQKLEGPANWGVSSVFKHDPSSPHSKC